MPLLKMTILAFKSFENPMDFMNPSMFIASFNPESYTINHNFTKDQKQTTGSSQQTAPTTSVNLKKMSFEFLIDGTGANGEEKIVLLEVKKFEKLVKSDSIIDSSSNSYLSLNKLLLLWGTFMFACEIESYAVKYTLFSQLGIPLRATISATFNESVAGSKLDIFDRLIDGDFDQVTHLHGFLSNAYSITQNVKKSVEMARAEDLNSLRG
ncbi:MAG TPA: hypothetical protein VLZ83_03875 [Edaphocola sp.]|nr:hypothetical protein [Edaphocola sp.]